MRQLSLRGKPDMYYFVDHGIDSLPQPTATRQRAPALRGDGARYRVCQKSAAQTIHSSPVHAEQVPSQNRLFFRERCSPQWTEHVCYLRSAVTRFVRNRRCRSSLTFIERISGIKGHDERTSKINGHSVIRPLPKRNARKATQTPALTRPRGLTALSFISVSCEHD